MMNQTQPMRLQYKMDISHGEMINKLLSHRKMINKRIMKILSLIRTKRKNKDYQFMNKTKQDLV